MNRFIDATPEELDQIMALIDRKYLDEDSVRWLDEWMSGNLSLSYDASAKSVIDWLNRKDDDDKFRHYGLLPRP